MEDRLKRLEMERDRDNIVLESTLKALGIETKNSRTNISLMCQTLLNAKIMLNSEEYVTIESSGGYIQAKAQGTLYKKSYIDSFPDILNGCHKDLEDGTVELDEEKYNAMIAAVL